MKENIFTFDFASLYPNVMKGFNIKPEDIRKAKIAQRKNKYKELFKDE